MSRRFFAALTRNWISLAGAALSLVSLVLIATLFAVEMTSHQSGPYLGILTFLVLPMFFALGLALMPVGIYFERRRMRQHPEHPEKGRFPIIDLNSPKIRGAVLVFLGLTVLNVVILATATYKGVEVMESVEFCGASCHTVMEPEYTAYQRSPHSRVTCAQCHIGPGADWFVKSKMDGAWQLVAVAFDLYPTPIPTPLENLRPARDTCEQCHWPSKFHGDIRDVKTSYRDDESNTEFKTALLLKVGGANGRESVGIHWHVDQANEVRYRSDESREEVYEVVLTTADGGTKTWVNREAPAEEGVWRTMDCVDCHNRPSHQYRQPHEEVDNAIHEGRIDSSLPFVKREGVRIINAEFPSIEEAKSTMAAELAQYYAENFPDIAAEKADSIAQAGEALGDRYALNVFPKMKVWWNTYPDHIGHDESPGCFRCHGGTLQTAEGAPIPVNCSTCHGLPLVSENDKIPEYYLETMGMSPPRSHRKPDWMAKHSDYLGELGDKKCAQCHGEIKFGVNDKTFCANSGCHAVDWQYLDLTALQIPE